VNPAGQATTVQFEHRSLGASTWDRTPPQDAGSSGSGQPVTAALTGLDAATTYEFRLVATNDSGSATGSTLTFTTPGCPAAVCDTTAPSSAADSPAFNTSGHFPVTYTAGDDAGGSGVARVDLYAKGPGDLGYALAASDADPQSSGSFSYAALLDGSYSFYTVATDQAGNVESRSAAQTTTVVDTVAPSSSASAPASSTSSKLTVGYAASDAGSGLARVDLYAKGPGDATFLKVDSASDGAPSGSFAYDATGDGTYRFFTVAVDKAGNAEAPPTGDDASTAVDAGAPTSEASAGAYANRTALTIAYTASDAGAGLAQVDLYAKAPGDSVYAKVASRTGSAASGSFAYTATAGDGSYSFYTRASDTAGNVEAAPSAPEAVVVVDTAAPAAQAGAPATAAVAPITVTYTASDPGGSGLATVDLYVKLPGRTTYAKAATDASPGAAGSFRYTPSAGNGTYGFYASATDKAGNERPAPGAADASTSYTLDRTAPASKAAAPATSTSGTWSVTYTASDSGGAGLASVELWAKAPGASAYAKVATDSSPGASGSIPYAAAGEGSYGFYTVAVDGAGNREAVPAAADGTTAYDLTPPTAFSMADPGQLLAGTVTLSVSPAPTDPLSGLASVRYEYTTNGGTSWGTACTATKAPWSCSWSTATAATPDGAYDLRAVATDAAHNSSTASNSPLAGRRIDNTRPTTKSIAAANVAGGTAGKAQTGDKLTFTYSEAIAPASILGGWTGAATSVRVMLIDNIGKDKLQVWRADGSARLALANPLHLGGDYVPTSGAVFNATMTQSGAAVTVVLGSMVSGSVQSKAATGGTMQWNPDTVASDLAGNTVTAAYVSAAGPAF
jgi:chitinase